MPRLSDLKIKLFTDGADKAQILDMAKQPWIAGFTTNPSLLKKAGVTNYAAYGRDLVARGARPAHLVRSVLRRHSGNGGAGARHRELGQERLRQAAGDQHARRPLFDAVRALSRDGIKVNMTAIFAPEQVVRAVDALAGGAPACVSVFAGRLADLGIDYRPIMQDADRPRSQDAERRDHLGLDPRGRSTWSKPTPWVATSSPRRPTC